MQGIVPMVIISIEGKHLAAKSDEGPIKGKVMADSERIREAVHQIGGHVFIQAHHSKSKGFD